MDEIELVIKIPEEVYKSIINSKNYISYREYIEEGIKNGIPLPKKHGRLKDVDWIDDNCLYHYSDIDGSCCYAVADIENAQTIIEANN